jgi:2,4-dienoyl-CoA reductase-like NADH-dependent reductase (Old Yellow Enzyme family)/thioredoxin reductase
MELANRLVMPSMGTNYGSQDGYVTERLIDYYAERAKDGPGLILTEMVCMDSPMGRRGSHQLRIDDDNYIEGLSRLTQQIHNNKRKMAIQICHAGILAETRELGLLPVGPSPVENSGGLKGRELTRDEIEVIITNFVQAALRGKKANFDGIEVHAAHGYLLAQFLSSAWNKRQDDFGGSVRNRARILTEIISRIRTAVGESYPVWYRMNGQEYGIEGGLTIDESKEIARMAEKAGSDAIHVSAFGYGTYYGYNRAGTGSPGGNLAGLAAEIKKVVTVPVIAVGKINLNLGEQLVRESKADLIAIGRGQIADPNLVKKAYFGKFDEIRPCISCNVCVDDLIGQDSNLHCSVNASVGKEREYEIKQAQKTKRVLVIGGGPGGMEAAIVAALRGHEVTILEKQPQLGGKLVLAAAPPHKDEIQFFTDYLINRTNKSGIKVELGKEADVNSVKKLKPDVVVLATGATPLVPKIQGIDNKKVVFAEEVLVGAETGHRVVVIGGGLVGCETAEFLVEKGKVVTIVEMLQEMAIDVNMSYKIALINRLTAGRMTMLTGAECQEISEKFVVVTTKDGQEQTIEADSVVLAVGAKPNIKLLKSIKDSVPEIHLVGDCVEPRRIINAVSDGHRIGLSI